MVDQLDIEAMQFMSSGTPIKSQTSAFNDIQLDLGGKRIKTRVPSRTIQSNSKRYISDEPERFVQYIEKIKDKFTTPENAKKAIKALWKKDKSLDHLLHANGAIVPSGKHIEERELNALLNVPKVKKWFKYGVVAKKLGVKPKVFDKLSKAIDEDKLKTLLNKIENYSKAHPKARKTSGITLKESQGIFKKRVVGTMKGKETEGVLTFAKIFSRKVPQYKDPKTKRFVKPPEPENDGA
jgi:hypothetical protein